MGRLAAFVRQPRLDRHLLAEAAVAHLAVALLVRALPFGRVRQLLDRAVGLGPACDDKSAQPGAAAGVIRAVRIVSAVLPGATCLTEALVAAVLLRRRGCETTLCFGLSSDTSDDRPFDAHAWLEHQGTTLIGARGIAYAPLAPPSRCAPSPSPR